MTMGSLLEPTPEFWARCGTMGQSWPSDDRSMGVQRFEPNPLNTELGVRCVPGQRGVFEVLHPDMTSRR
jgi:hypothetical protein